MNLAGCARFLVRTGALGLCLGACAPGTFTRTIYVPPGKAVQLRETIKDAAVWVLDETGTPVAGQMDLPEGWFCLPEETDK